MITASALGRAAAAAAAVLAIAACGAPAAGDTAPQDVAASPERAIATVQPALVRVTGTFTGRVRDAEGRYAHGGNPYTITFSCTGFGVHPDGYIATVGHCVDANDVSVRDGFIRPVAEQAAAGRSDVTVDQLVEYGWSAWVVEGRVSGSPVESEIRVSGIPGAPPDGVLARVVDDRPIGQGDVALLKIDTTVLPTVELAAGTALTPGMPVLVAGFPDNAGDVVGPTTRPTVGNGTVIGSLAEGGRPVHEIDTGGLEVGMSGAPAVDPSGRVLGLTTLREDSTQRLDLVVPISGFTDLLGRNGVTAELGPRDRLYRESLDHFAAREYTDAIDAVDRLQREGPVHPRVEQLRADAEAARARSGDASENRTTQALLWTGGAVGVLLVVVVGVLLLVRRRRRRPAVVMGTPPMPYPGAPWQGGQRPPGPMGGPPHRHPYPPPHPRMGPPGAPMAARRPAPDPFGGPTRPVVLRPPAEGATTAIVVPDRAGPPGASGDAAPEGATVSIVLPRAGAGDAATPPADHDDPPKDEKDA
jgi:serine protease Do